MSFAYEFNGECLESWMPVHQSSEVLALRESQEIDILVDATRPRRVTAKAVGLQVHSGRMTDGEDYYLYVGHRLGWIGLEGDRYTTLSEPQFLEIAASVRKRLVEAGFHEQPEIHLQLEAQY